MFSEQLKILRKKLGVTQKTVAEAIGVAESAYRGYEIGVTKDPRMSTLIALADYFNVSIDELVGRKVGK